MVIYPVDSAIHLLNNLGLKYFRNIDCVLTNNNEDQTTNHKLLITVTDYS